MDTSHEHAPHRREFETVNRSLVQLAQRLVADAQAAEDVAQDAWLAALGHAPGRIRDLSRWLTGATRRLALDHVRREARRQQSETRGARSAESTTARSAHVREAALWELREEVGRMAEPYRGVISLRYLDGLKVTEIASRLERPATTVKTQLRRGLEKLRARMDDRHGGDRRAWLSGLSLTAGAPGVRTAEAVPHATSHPVVNPGALFRNAVRVGTLAAVGTLAVLVVLRAAPELVGGSASARPQTQSPNPPALAFATASQRVAQVAEASDVESEVPPVPTSSRRLLVQSRRADGALVSGAEIYVLGPTGLELRGTTDARGELAFDVADADLGHFGFPGTQEHVSVLARVALGNDSELYTVPCPADESNRVVLPVAGPAQVISGRVLDSRGEPVGGARVETGANRFFGRVEGSLIITSAPNEQMTGVDGSFHFDGLLPGVHELTVSAAGFAPHARGYGSRAAEPVVVEIRLSRQASIRGRVDATALEVGQPVRVWAVSTTGQRVETDAVLGEEYLLDSIAPGRQRVFAQAAQDKSWGARAVLDLRPGQEALWDPQLTPSAGLHLRIENELGQPLADKFVRIYAQDGPPWSRALDSDSRGNIDLDICPAGALTVTVNRCGRSPFPCAVFRDVREDLQRQTLRLESEWANKATLVVDFASWRPEDGVETEFHMRNHPYLSESTFPYDLETGSLLAEELPPGPFEIMVTRGARGVVHYQSVLLASNEELHVGPLSEPLPGRVEIELPAQQASASCEWELAWAGGATPSESWPFLRRAGLPPPVLELFPGAYLLRILCDGIEVQTHSFVLQAGDNVRLR